MVSGGCIISGATVRHSLLFSSVRVESYSLVEDSLILPEVDIGQRCTIRHAIIEKGCVIPDDTRIGIDLEEDKKHYYVTREGVYPGDTGNARSADSSCPLTSSMSSSTGTCISPNTGI